MKRDPIEIRPTFRHAVMALSIAAAFGLASAPASAQVAVNVGISAPEPGWLYDLGAVVSLFIDPPVVEPQPVAIAWAPPPMLVEEPPPQPDPAAIWTGGYWTWQGDWVWCAGRWSRPPRENYVWVQPYYEHREDRVIFIPGYWSQPDVEFIAPPVAREVPWAYVGAGVVVGPPPEGPAGIFVPPPPGSRPGIIIPAPIGTPPQVVISAPPVLNVGMRISGSVTIDARHTVINDNRVTNYSVTNVRNVTNVTVIAPASATANGHAFQAQVPHRASLAAAQRPMVAALAPRPESRTAVAAYVPGHTVAALPKAQKVQGLPQVPQHPAATVPPKAAVAMGHAPITPEQARQQHAAAGGNPAHVVDTEHMAAPAAGGAHPGAAQAAPNENLQQEQAQQRQRQQAEREQQQAQQQHQQQAEQQQRDEQAQHQQQTEQQQRQQAERQRTEQEQRQQQSEQSQRQQAQQAQQQREQEQRQQQVEQQQQREQQAQHQQRAEQQQRQEQAEQQQRQQQAEQQQRAQQAQRQQQAEQQQHQQQAEQQQRAQEQRQQQARQQAEQAQQQRAQQEQQKAEEQRSERAKPQHEEASRPAGRE